VYENGRYTTDFVQAAVGGSDAGLEMKNPAAGVDFALARSTR
jgi:hypothetical protein